MGCAVCGQLEPIVRASVWIRALFFWNHCFLRASFSISFSIIRSLIDDRSVKAKTLKA